MLCDVYVVFGFQWRQTEVSCPSLSSSCDFSCSEKAKTSYKTNWIFAEYSYFSYKVSSLKAKVRDIRYWFLYQLHRSSKSHLFSLCKYIVPIKKMYIATVKTLSCFVNSKWKDLFDMPLLRLQNCTSVDNSNGHGLKWNHSIHAWKKHTHQIICQFIIPLICGYHRSGISLEKEKTDVIL